MGLPASLWLLLAVSVCGALLLWEHCWLAWSAFRLGDRRWPLAVGLPGYGAWLAWGWGLRFAALRYAFWFVAYVVLRLLG